MKKKIVVVLNTEPEWGGEHQYALILMKCLIHFESDNTELLGICETRFWRKWCRDNHIRILCDSWYILSEKQRKIHIKYPIFSRIWCMYMTELGKLFRVEKIDAVIATTQGLFIPNVNLKVIAPVHDLMHRYEGRFSEVKNKYEERELICISRAKYSWCVLTDSKVGKRQFIESYAWCKRKTLHHVISLPYIVPQHIIQCKEEFIDTPNKYVFYPAQFWTHKNHLNLLRAIKILVHDIPDIHLVLVGSEKNAMKKVKQYIRKNKLDSYITINGFVSNGNVVYLYRHAVGLIMPSYFGPTNIPPLEAMALGCPVAVSNRYAMPEQVGSAGLLFDPDSPGEIAKCIRKLWLNEDLRNKLRELGYMRIQRWTEREFKNKLRNILSLM